MENDQLLNRTRDRVLFGVWLLYLGAALAYSFVSTIHSTGLGGRIVAWQLASLGWASLQMAVLLTMGICCVPLVIASVLFRKFNPEAARSFHAYRKAAVYSGFPTPMTWGFVFKIIGGVLLLGSLVCGYLYLSDKQEEAMPVYQVDLSKAPAGVDHRTGFIELTGIAASKYTLVFHNGGKMPSTNVYVPVVQPGWTPASPVRYIVHYKASAYQTGPPDLPYEFVASTPSVFPGKLWGDMVEGFKKRYAKLGLNIAPDALVVDWVELSDHHVVASKDSLLLASIITAVVAFLTLVILSLAKLQNGLLATRK